MLNYFNQVLFFTERFFNVMNLCYGKIVDILKVDMLFIVKLVIWRILAHEY